MHPSMGHPDDDDQRSLPEGVTEEGVDSLVRAVIEATNGIGLYATPRVEMHFHGDLMLLNMQFDIGQVAFTKRVQDPEQDKFDDSFRGIEGDAVRDKVKGIKERFSDPEDG